MRSSIACLLPVIRIHNYRMSLVADVNILQGSVVTRLQSGGIFNLLCYKFSVNKRIMIIGQYRIRQIYGGNKVASSYGHRIYNKYGTGFGWCTSYCLPTAVFDSNFRRSNNVQKNCAGLSNGWANVIDGRNLRRIKQLRTAMLSTRKNWNSSGQIETVRNLFDVNEACTGDLTGDDWMVAPTSR